MSVHGAVVSTRVYPTRRWVAAFVALVFVAGGILAGSSLRTMHRDTALSLSIPGGTVQVLDVRDEVLAHNPSMPAEMMSQPVPAGHRRLHVDVTLVAESAVSYAPERFSVEAEDGSVAVPVRSSLGTGTAPPGSAVAGTLVYEVPEDAQELAMRFEGADGSLLLPLDGEAPAGHDH